MGTIATTSPFVILVTMPTLPSNKDKTNSGSGRIVVVWEEKV
jgi:hypothetical protein